MTMSHVCVAVLGALLPVMAEAQIPVTAIKAGRLVDPESGTTAADQIILVQGGRVTAVGAGLAIPTGAQVIDLSAATVMPGLFDAHAHLCTTIGHPAEESVRGIYESLLVSTLSDTVGYRAIQGAANARSMLESGFTTVRDVGNAGNFADTDVRRALEEGLIDGPTLINAGRIISPTGGQFPPEAPPLFRQLFGMGHEHTGVLRPDRPGLGEPEYLFADTRDEMRKAVRENVLYGARVIKIVMDDQPYAYDADDVRTLVAEAARAGLKVAAHSMTDAGARAAAEGGAASIEHAFLLTDATIQVMKRNSVVLVGTDFPKAALKELGIPEVMYEKVVDRLKRAHAAGVPLAFGTDIFFAPPGFTRGSFAASYVDVYKDVGIPARDVLRMMTTNAARLLGVEKERGAIKPGLAADIIATSADPLADLAALKKVVFVMKNGKVIRKMD